MEVALHTSVELAVRSCAHCGNPVPRRAASAAYCCAGCESVSLWLKARSLDQYYSLKDRTPSFRKPNPVSGLPGKYGYLDDQEFLTLYSWATPEGRWMDLYVEGVHCAACVWLTEKLTEILAEVGYARLNLATSVLTVRIGESGKFEEVANELGKMGYRVHPVDASQSSRRMLRENRLFLARLGVAAAAAGNIMLLAVSLYAGARGSMADRFRWISFGLFVPVMLFSAVPFYRSAWSALRAKSLSIDVPVVFGLTVGAVVSTFNLITGDDRVYFDSIATLVFLLLSTRYLLRRFQQSAFESSRLLSFLAPHPARRWVAEREEFEVVPVNRICIGDRLEVLAGESVPADGVVLQGYSHLDCALLTGEPHPERKVPGDLIFAGTVNLDGPLVFEATSSGSGTRLGRIIGEMERIVAQKARISVFADRVSRYFVAAVLVLSALAFGWGLQGGGWAEGLNRALAVAIVTCPCTFALITPLALTLTLGRLARAGILVKGPHVLERLAEIQTVFLDKTGTITRGQLEVAHCSVPAELWGAVVAIEARSIHPVARALVAFFRPRLTVPMPSVLEIQETLGQGIRGRLLHDWIELRRAPSAGRDTQICVLRNGEELGRITLADRIRPDSRLAVDRLRRLGLDPWLLSGDHAGPVASAAAEVGIAKDHWISEASPERKRQVVEAHSRAAMVGDGANDAIAIAAAHVGIAAHGGMEISLRAADVYLGTSGIVPVHALIVASRETLSVVRRNLGLSLVYNFVAAGFALAGKIDPLLAAVLMPASALLVFVSSVAGTRRLRQAFRELGP